MNENEIILPHWVYRNLDKFHNVLLPRNCVKIDREMLLNHLQKKSGLKINLREIELEDVANDFYIKKHIKTTKFLIAETR